MTDAAHDRFAILEVGHSFDFTIDGGDFDAHTALFTEDFTFESDYGDHDSVESYREWVEGFHSQMKEKGGTRHVMSNPVVMLDGDEAEVEAYLVIYSQGDGSVLGTAVTRDRMRRVDGTWKIAKRVLRVDANARPDG